MPLPYRAWGYNRFGPSPGVAAMKRHSNLSHVAYDGAAALALTALAALAWMLTRDAATTLQEEYTSGVLVGALAVTVLSFVTTLLLAR